MCSCPGRGSSSPSRHLSGSPAVGTTDQRHLCSGWQSPPWAGGSHCGRREEVDSSQSSSRRGPRKRCPRPTGSLNPGAWFLCPAPNRAAGVLRPSGHHDSDSGSACWGRVHRTALQGQLFPLHLWGGGGPSASLSVHEKGKQRSPDAAHRGPLPPMVPHTAPQPVMGPRTQDP